LTPIDHIPCRDLPAGLNEETFIKIEKSVDKYFRYKLHQLEKTQDDKGKAKQDLTKIFKQRRSEYLGRAMKLEGITLGPDEKRDHSQIMRWAYLDFETKSFQQEGVNDYRTLLYI
jgi:hypothetical protein